MPACDEDPPLLQTTLGSFNDPAALFQTFMSTLYHAKEIPPSVSQRATTTDPKLGRWVGFIVFCFSFIPLRFILLLLHRDLFDTHLHALTTEGDILSFQLLPRLMAHVMCDRVCHESDGCDDCEEDEEDDQRDYGSQFGHDAVGWLGKWKRKRQKRWGPPKKILVAGGLV